MPQQIATKNGKGRWKDVFLEPGLVPAAVALARLTLGEADFREYETSERIVWKREWVWKQDNFHVRCYPEQKTMFPEGLLVGQGLAGPRVGAQLSFKAFELIEQIYQMALGYKVTP